MQDVTEAVRKRAAILLKKKVNSIPNLNLLPQRFESKTQAECIFHAQNLHMSKKSSNFAPSNANKNSISNKKYRM